MNSSEVAQNAYAFFDEFKAEILRQIDELNVIADGALQDGYNVWYVDDGWISMQGFAWGFVMHYDDPVRMDMTFGPGWPFVGYRVNLLAKPIGERLAWVNQINPDEVCFDAQQLARYGLRKLACKTGDSWLFEGDQPVGGHLSAYNPMPHDSLREHI